jgi:hypothetical protein
MGALRKDVFFSCSREARPEVGVFVKRCDPAFRMKMQMLDIAGLRQNTSEGFRSALAEMALSIGLDPSLVAACMRVETGGTYSPSIQNPYTKATGLIQFMPKTALSMGTTIEQLASMSATAQLEYVKRYFRPYLSRIRPWVPGDYYLAVFMPAYIGRDPSTVLFSSGQTGYAQNAGLDRDGDGFITVGDVTTTINRVVAEAQTRPPIEVDVGTSMVAWTFGGLVAVLVGTALYERRREVVALVEKHATLV